MDRSVAERQQAWRLREFTTVVSVKINKTDRLPKILKTFSVSIFVSNTIWLINICGIMLVTFARWHA